MRLKKRVREEAVEEGSSASEPADYPKKKLRLIVKDRTYQSVLDGARVVRGVEAALRQLRSFATDFLAHLDSGDEVAACERLAMVAAQRSEPPVRVEALRLMRSVLGDTFLDADDGARVVAQLRAVRVEEASPCDGVCAALLAVWANVCSRSTVASEHSAPAPLAQRALTHPNWRCRAEALKLLAFSGRSTRAAAAADALESTLCHYATDRDARVRVAAVSTLWKVCCNADELVAHRPLPVSNYTKICQLLSDACEQVRLTALHIVKFFADHYSEQLVCGPNDGVQLRLVDDVFSRLCNAIHDLSVTVRTQAAKLLGSLTGVSANFLAQTLDKKLMSNMRFGGKGAARSKRASQWATGKTLGGDMPVERAEDESTSLMPSGACGAFVVGLEDECLSVREASVRALGRLAADRPALAARALDFLADMFNDEIAEVRLDAIRCMSPLVGHGRVGEDQLETMLNVLDDATPDSRAALRELLCRSKLTTPRCLKAAVAALLKNFKRFPLDRRSILHCAQRLGAAHAAFVQPMVVSLLDIHPFLDSPEPNIEDVHYLVKLVVVLNAAADCPAVRSMLPAHAWRHYHFLQQTSSSLVPPNLRAGDVRHASTITQSDVCAKTLLDHSQSLLLSAQKVPVVSQIQILSLLSSDLNQMGLTDAALTAPIKFLELLVELLKLMERVCGNGADVTDSQVAEGLLCLSRTAIQFSSLPVHLEVFLAATRVRLIGLALCQRRQTVGRDSLVGRALDDAVDSLSQSVRSVSFAARPARPLRLLARMDSGEERRALERLAETAAGALQLAGAADAKPPTDVRAALLEGCCRPPPYLAGLLGVAARRCEAVDTASDTVRFVANLVTSTSFKATLHGFDAALLNQLKIQVTYPDSRTEYFRPRQSDFSQISDNSWHLNTDVLLHADLWSESAAVQMRPLLALPDDTAALLRAVAAVPSERLEFQLDGDSLVKIMLYPKARC